MFRQHLENHENSPTMIPVDDDFILIRESEMSFFIHVNNQANGHGKYERVNLLLLKKTLF